MIGRIRGRDQFARLAREGTRIRSSALWCQWCPDPTSTTTCVAFAVGRAYGPAVRRNRLRRRLRSLLASAESEASLPTGLLLIGAARSASTELSFDQVARSLHELLEQIRRVDRPHERSV